MHARDSALDLLDHFDQFHDAVLATDCECTIVYWNRAAERLHGYAASEVLGKNVSLTIPPEEYAKIHADLLRDRPLRDRLKIFDTVMITKDGRRMPTHLRLQALYGPNSAAIGLLGTTIDRTAQLESQAQILAQERELRAVITRELHHRVKNSLQGAAGLLRMQTNDHPALAESAANAISQLLATAVGFGLLGRSGDNGVYLADLIREIAANVSQVTGSAITVNIATSLTPDPAWIDQKYLMNLSLIINELLVNAVKHNAPGGDRRPPEITAYRHRDVVNIDILNRGGPLPKGFSFDKAQGLGTGLTLVRLMLPSSNCSLSFRQASNGVLAFLQVHPPAP